MKCVIHDKGQWHVLLMTRVHTNGWHKKTLWYSPTKSHWYLNQIKILSREGDIKVKDSFNLVRY